MTSFVDTSALLAVLHAGDANHARAARSWRRLVESDEGMVTTSYVLVETLALVQYRFGVPAVAEFQDAVAPLLTTVWVDADLHAEGVAGLLTARRRGLSLVDCVSFASMRRLEISRAFHFDRHFTEQGFATVD